MEIRGTRTILGMKRFKTQYAPIRIAYSYRKKMKISAVYMKAQSSNELNLLHRAKKKLLKFQIFIQSKNFKEIVCIS